MIETLTIINTAALITMFMIYPLVRGQRGANAFMHPLAGDKLSMLNRRRKALHLATKEWHGKVDRGYTNLAGDSKRLVDQLEREVAALEDELFAAAEEATPKPEAPKLEHDTTMSGEYLREWGWIYRGTCSACDWRQDSRSPQTVVEEGVDHEMRYS